MEIPADACRSNIFETLKGIFETMPGDSLKLFAERLFSRLFNYHITGSKGELRYDLSKVSAFLFLVRFCDEDQERRSLSETANDESKLDEIIKKCVEDVPHNAPLVKLLKKGVMGYWKEEGNIGKDINFGKMFQSLIPLQIRKHIAAYYTKPGSARLLSLLAINENIKRIADFSCGAGILLEESYRALISINSVSETNQLNAINKKDQFQNEVLIPEKNMKIELFGSDILQSALILTKFNLSNLDSANMISFDLLLFDGLSINPETELPDNRKLGLFDMVIENPPFTRTERISQAHHNESIQKFINSRGLNTYYSKRMGLQLLFLMHADSMLKESGTLAFVLPANIFNIDTKSYLQKFLKDKGYAVEYLISLNSNEFSFSEDCSYKELLFIARKGLLNASSSTKFVQISKIPELQSCKAVATAILSSNDSNFSIDSVAISINRINTNELLTTNMKWDIYFWKKNSSFFPIHDWQNSDHLIPLSESNEITVRVGFHSTFSDYLIFPNIFFDITIDSSNPDNVILTRKEDQKQIVLPSKFFASSLREPKIYSRIIDDSAHFVYIHSDDLSGNTFEALLGYLTKKLKNNHQKKIERGLRTAETLEERWYEHPVKTGAKSKKANLFTFNRYGLWKRTNLCIYIRNRSTANDGFHLYAYNGKELEEKEALLLLCSWFNCSFHIVDFLMNCRVPATHVQQVSLSDRMKMLVPKIGLIETHLRERILETTERLNEKSALLITEQLKISERKALDLLWMQVIGLEIENEKKEEYLDKLYTYIRSLLENR